MNQVPEARPTASRGGAPWLPAEEAVVWREGGAEVLGPLEERRPRSHSKKTRAMLERLAVEELDVQRELQRERARAVCTEEASRTASVGASPPPAPEPRARTPGLGVGGAVVLTFAIGWFGGHLSALLSELGAKPAPVTATPAPNTRETSLAPVAPAAGAQPPALAEAPPLRAGGETSPAGTGAPVAATPEAGAPLASSTPAPEAPAPATAKAATRTVDVPAPAAPPAFAPQPAVVARAPAPVPAPRQAVTAKAAPTEAEAAGEADAEATDAPLAEAAPLEMEEEALEAAPAGEDAAPEEDPFETTGDDDSQLADMLAAIPSADKAEGSRAPAKEAPQAAAAAQAPSVYVPPPVGTQALPETLGREEVLAVVSAGAQEVAACAQAHPSGAEALVAVWTIRPDGSTAGVEVEPAAARDAALARCVSERIARWRFPAHRAQMGPIRFPFSFASR